MKSGDIDDLLLNVDENFDENPQSKGEELKGSSAEKESLKEKESQKDTAKSISLSKMHESADLSFLENVDSDDSKDEYDEYEKKIKEELSLDHSEDAGRDPAEKTGEEIQAETENITKIKIEKVKFILRGTRTWNTREPYVLPVNYDKLNIDYKDLYKTFYLIKVQSDGQNIQGEMKRAMFKFIRNPEKYIIHEYTEFINNNLFSLTAELGNYFGFQNENLQLFVYHLGILTLYKIIIIRFQTDKIGYCYKLQADNNVVRYIPFEFVKEVILQWHNDNIIGNDYPYDGIIEYNDLKRVVSRRYTSEYEKYNSKLDDLISKSKLSTSASDRDEIFKSKWDDWFGKTNILVYNRFLERTIFKIVK
ncbi:MAG: hypothetical protein JXN64_11580 [Spirochaetes bacterium]|nr:hypothetical protein [Spirochaetota bacterium]